MKGLEAIVSWNRLALNKGVSIDYNANNASLSFDLSSIPRGVIYRVTNFGPGRVNPWTSVTITQFTFIEWKVVRVFVTTTRGFIEFRFVTCHMTITISLLSSIIPVGIQFSRNFSIFHLWLWIRLRLTFPAISFFVPSYSQVYRAHVRTRFRSGKSNWRIVEGGVFSAYISYIHRQKRLAPSSHKRWRQMEAKHKKKKRKRRKRRRKIKPERSRIFEYKERERMARTERTVLAVVKLPMIPMGRRVRTAGHSSKAPPKTLHLFTNILAFIVGGFSDTPISLWICTIVCILYIKVNQETSETHIYCIKGKRHCDG